MVGRTLRRLVCAAAVLVALTACEVDDRAVPSDAASGSATAAAESRPSRSSEAISPTVPPAAPTPPPQTRGADVLFSTNFDGDVTTIFVGETEFGAQASIKDGKYVVEVEDREWQTITVDQMARLRNGSISADIALKGSGFGGLVARSQTDLDRNTWMYVCILDETGWAGCVASHGDTYENLFWGEIPDYVAGAAQRFTMNVIGDRIELVINGQSIGSAHDSSLQLGSWGVYAESQSDAVTVIEFDNLSIHSAPDVLEPDDSIEEDDRRTV